MQARDIEDIVTLIMERDGLDYEDAQETVSATQDQINEELARDVPNLVELEDIMQSGLGLEPDYLEIFLPW